MCCNFSYGFAHWKTYLLLVYFHFENNLKLLFFLNKFFVCFTLISDFVLVLLRWWKMFQILARYDHKAITLLFVFVMLTKCCIFAIKTELWLLSKLFISSASVKTATFCWESFGFLSFSVIVTLVNSREGLVEPLLWSFVIAPLLSFSKLL